MSGAHEKLEHAEHAAHEGGHERGSKVYGVTMALIGVLIALCSAMVGSERNELTRKMIEQTQAHADWTAASTKYRLVLIELEKQRARVVAARDPANGESPVKRFIELSGDYGEERDFAKKWAESYHPIVEAHFDGAEGYEHAQLIAEVGIVMASLAVLLASRAAWLISVCLAVGSMVQVARTYLPTRQVVNEALVQVQKAQEAYEGLRRQHTGVNEDTQILDRLDGDGKIRAAIAQESKNHKPAAVESEAKAVTGK